MRRKKVIGCVDGTVNVNVMCHCNIKKVMLFFSTLEKTCRDRREREQSTGLSQVNKQERR